VAAPKVGDVWIDTGYRPDRDVLHKEQSELIAFAFVPIRADSCRSERLAAPPDR